ncbi:hypothetical protein D7V80_16305 [Corallococcus sp. CA054B]|uniref:protein kinase domain-containing protein n=1 Tax=Corallococcus sp. CA054B TaxID=2316734 RepID=UPI000EA22284|nr:protein kinase [Corallococcus sp. CA054B]RKG67372.1 hypothetical protein D7V80_16305 [Corallococcus sp. CA054B]
MPDTTTDDLARTKAAQRRRQLPPTPDRPLHLFTLDGIRYEAVRELVLMQTGELLMLAQRFSERAPTLPGFCFVRRLANPSTYLQRTRLGEEIQLAFRLRHPAIAQVFHRKVRQGALHVVMESVDGPSLETLVSAGVARGRPVSESFALYVGAEIAEALHHAHTLTDAAGQSLGVIHRDVNPRHVYVGTQGEVKLTNFGAAYSLVVGREESPANLVRGDVAYASPDVKAMLHVALRANPDERFATAADMRDAMRVALARRHPGYGRQEAAAEWAQVLAEGSGLRDAVEFGEGGLFREGLEVHELEGLKRE